MRSNLIPEATPLAMHAGQLLVLGFNDGELLIREGFRDLEGAFEGYTKWIAQQL